MGVQVKEIYFCFGECSHTGPPDRWDSAKDLSHYDDIQAILCIYFLIRFVTVCINKLSPIPLQVNFSNNFIKSIPANIKNCQDLHTLIGNDNKLRSLPASIGQIKTLKYVNFQNNQVCCKLYFIICILNVHYSQV